MITAPGTGVAADCPSAIEPVYPHCTPPPDPPIEPPAITFDAGQTVIDLDLAFLARRLAERGVAVERAALAAAAPAAWQHYDALIDPAGGHPWREFMRVLLTGAGIPADRIAALVDWLWDEQPRANLWRAEVPGMVALARELSASGVPVAVLSNSEGRLAELLAEIGIADAFSAVVDSGRIGIEKPDRRIFDHTLAALGVTQPGIHIGDSWPADIQGALGAGWRAIWFGRRASPVADPRVAVARDAASVRAALWRWFHW
jgi:HAD superfamily hydrolase (TIGR01549 family)